MPPRPPAAIHAARRWPGGFRASLHAASDTEQVRGEVRVVPRAAPQVVLHGPPSPLGAWARAHAAAMAGEGPPWALGDAGPDVSTVHRVDDEGAPVEVVRTAGPVRVMVSVLDRVAARDGWLPRAFTVAHWDLSTRRLRRVDMHRDEHAVVGGAVVPTRRRVVIATDSGAELRHVTLTDHARTDARGAA